MRLIRYQILCVAIFGLLTASCARDSEKPAAQNNPKPLPMKPGLWETQVTFTDIQVQGLSANKKQKLLNDISQRLSGKSCLSAKQARKPDANFFAGGQSNDCSYQKFHIAGDQLDLTVSCSMKSMATITINMNGTVGADETDLDIKPALRLPLIGEITLQGKAKGQYLGACETGK